MALFQTQAFSRGLRIGLMALILCANVAAGAQINAQIHAPAAITPQQIGDITTRIASSAEAQISPANSNQAFLDPANCLQASWAPFSNTTFIVPQGTLTTQVAISVTALVAIDANTVEYTVYTPNGGNSAWAKANTAKLSDFTVIMTATDIPVSAPSNGALSSVQFKISRKNKGSTDLDACSPVHTVFAASKKFYLPLIFKSSGDNFRDITTLEEPNNTTCQAALRPNIEPYVKYTSRLNDKEDIYKIMVPVTSTMIVTVTGFTTGGQVQVRKSSGSCDTGTLYNSTSYQGDALPTRQVVVLNVLPGEVYVRIASTADLPPNTDYGLVVALGSGTTATGPYEPNNTACQAYPIVSGTTYQAYPEDNSDWYSFTLANSANLVLNITNLNVTVGQYSLYKADDCSTINVLTTTPVTRQDKATTSIDLGTQTAGKYFLRVAVGSGANSASLYSLRVVIGTATGVWKPQGEVCGVNGCSRPSSAGENVKASWTGMPGLTSLKLKITTKAVGNCPAGKVSSITPSGYGDTFGNLTLSENGSLVFSNVPKGWYIFTFEGVAPGRTTYLDDRAPSRSPSRSSATRRW